MTSLLKPVTRVVDFGRGPVAVTLRPDGLIVFRHKRGRKAFAVPIGAVYVNAVARAVSSERAARKRGAR